MFAANTSKILIAVLCIFCLQERPPSVEHVFPDAVGGRLTIERVCKPCNDRLGADADPLVTEHALVVMRRHQIGMKDRSGKAVSPWRGAFAKPVLGDDPSLRLRWEVDPVTGHPHTRVLHTAKTVSRADGTKEEWVAIDASGGPREVEKIIKRERSRRGLPALDANALAAQVAAVIGSIRTIEKPSVTSEIALDTVAFARGLGKVAYELAWIWLGDAYLADPMAGILRQSVLTGDMTGVRGSSVIGADNAAFKPWAAEIGSHMGLGMISPDGRLMMIAVRIFDVLSGVFQVSGRAAGYSNARRGGFVMTGPGTPTVRQSGFHEELTRVFENGFRAP